MPNINELVFLEDGSIARVRHRQCQNKTSETAVSADDKTAMRTALGVGGAFSGFADGTVGAPGAYFASDANTGLYRIGDDHMAVAVGGQMMMDLYTNVVVIPTLQVWKLALENNYQLLVADNTEIIFATALHRLDSDSAVADDRVFTIADGPGLTVDLRLWFVGGANRCKLVNTGNVSLASDWAPTATGQLLQLMWDGTKWLELWRR